MPWSKSAAANPDRNPGPGQPWTYSWPDALGDVAMKPALGEKVSTGGRLPPCRRQHGRHLPLSSVRRRDNTAIMGSSLGGIASVAMAQRHPDVFSKAGGMSSSFWWNQKSMIAHLAARGSGPGAAVRFYLDAGTEGDGLEETMQMRDAMVKQGYVTGTDLLFHRFEGGSHNEKSWGRAGGKALDEVLPMGEHAVLRTLAFRVAGSPRNTAACRNRPASGRRFCRSACRFCAAPRSSRRWQGT
jgi:pimeloyl-ACP methyl ester carboxylesterase